MSHSKAKQWKRQNCHEIGSEFLVIVFVIDIFDVKKNGTTMTARRFAEYLRKKGHEVRVVSTGEPAPDKFLVPEKHTPIVNYFSQKQNFVFARPVESTLRKALEGADIVHLFLPMGLERKAYQIAREMGIPCSAAFHLQPENITFNIGMGNWKWLSDQIYFWMYRMFYRHFDHIHCPSHFIAEQLKLHGYRAKLHVISNGITDEFTPLPQPKPIPKEGEPYHILMIGRLSPEKRQDLIISAALQSKYKDRIQLHFAGTGPREGALRKLASPLKHSPTFGYYQKEELLQLIHSCDLYIHASDAEIEAIACLEAVACGLVPIISDSKRSATSQFALDGRSTFAAGDASDLSKKIDYWMEHPEEKQKMSALYAESAGRYSIDSCIQAAEEMFHETIQDDHNRMERLNGSE